MRWALAILLVAVVVLSTIGTPSIPGASAQVVGSDSTFKIMSTTEDSEISYRFTVDGDVSKTIAADGTAADDDDTVRANEDGTVTVIGSTGDQFGDAFTVTGEIVSFQKTGGESGYELSLDGADVTDEIPDSPDDGDQTPTPTDTPTETLTETPTESGSGSNADGGAGGDEGTDDGPTAPGDSDDVYGDSTFDTAHTRSIQSNGDGGTTVSGEVWNYLSFTTNNVVMVVEVYDENGNWIDSGWDTIGTVGPERQPYSVTFDVPREEIDSVRVDANRLVTSSSVESPSHYGPCPEIHGDGPSNQEVEADTGNIDIVTGPGDGVTVVGAADNYHSHDLDAALVAVSIYDDSGEVMATQTTIVWGVAEGETREYAVRFENAEGVADVRADADGLGLQDGRLTCRPPL